MGFIGYVINYITMYDNNEQYYGWEKVEGYVLIQYEKQYNSSKN